jgi:hypothetical protein
MNTKCPPKWTRIFHSRSSLYFKFVMVLDRQSSIRIFTEFDNMKKKKIIKISSTLSCFVGSCDEFLAIFFVFKK